MRIIARGTLRQFWQTPNHSDAERPLIEWYHLISRAHWRTPQDIKQDLRHASILKNGRVVFNIGGNKYRIIASIDYTRQILWIKFVGTHAQYDNIYAEQAP